MEPVSQREHVIVVRRAHLCADDQPRVRVLEHVQRDGGISERGQDVVLLVGRPHARERPRAIAHTVRGPHPYLVGRANLQPRDIDGGAS